MAVDIDVIARQLFEDLLAPLVVGGSVSPRHAIGGKKALALGESPPSGIDAELEERVLVGRVRRARELVPIDRLPPATAAEWMMGAALHDVLQAANPTFDTILRRSAAARILEVARATMDRVVEPATVHEALARHTWFARVLSITRTDTAVSWWTGSQTYLGVEPPPRLSAWPELRRVAVTSTPRPLVELEPLAVERAKLIDTVGAFLARTPLTEIATCTRTAPAFIWGSGLLALVGSRPGQTLALRALARLPAQAVDISLGRATRDLLMTDRANADPAIALLAERALAQADGHHERVQGPGSPEAAFAGGIGAVAAARMLNAPDAPWSDQERRRLLVALEPATRSPAAREAAALLGKDA